MEPKEFHWPFSFLYSLLTPLMEPGYRDLSSRMGIQVGAESLLDLGGADGRLAVALAQMYPGLCQIVSGDISEDMTERARRRIAKADLSSVISAECLDMHALPYDDAEFDAVVSFGTLHHARRPSAFLTEAYRVLRPGGRMCLIDGYGRPTFAAIRKTTRAFGGSLASAIAYWCGSKDCLSQNQISSLVSQVSVPGIQVTYDALLATISTTKQNVGYGELVQSDID